MHETGGRQAAGDRLLADVADEAEGFERRPGRRPLRLPFHKPGRRAVVTIAGAVLGVLVMAVLLVRGTGTAAPPALVSSPPARQSAAMAYDSVAGVTVMYGGYTAGDALLDDTWLWNGSTWAPAQSRLSPRLASPSLTDDPADGGVLLVGGAPLPISDPRCAGGAACTGGGAVPVTVQTWLFRAGGWQEVAGAGDEPLVPSTLATVPDGAGIVAVADTTVRNCEAASACPDTPAVCLTAPTSVECLNSIRVSTWSWSEKRWTPLHQVVDLDSGLVMVPSANGATLELVSLYAPPHPSCINADGGCPVIVTSPRSWHWGGGGWIADPATTILPPLQPGLVAVEGARSALLTTDGRSWVLTDGTWVAPAGGAPMTPHYGGALAADPNGGWLLFGGAGRPGGASDDTWLLTAGGWRRVAGTSASTMRG